MQPALVAILMLGSTGTGPASLVIREAESQSFFCYRPDAPCNDRVPCARAWAYVVQWVPRWCQLRLKWKGV